MALGKININCINVLKPVSTVFLFLIFFNLNAQQKITFGVHADPIICWFGSDNSSVKNEGARPGFNFGLTYNKYFGDNYSFSSGINIISAGGRLVSSDTTRLQLDNYQNGIAKVLPGGAMIYKVQYLSIPLGLKLQTNQIGYITFFTDLGLDPKVVIGGSVDVPSLDIKGEKALSELRTFNLSYHIMAGIEYSLGGNTAFVLGLGFDNNFLDITKDLNGQPVDKISHRLLSFRLGVNF
jgi:hypothetical protein